MMRFTAVLWAVALLGAVGCSEARPLKTAPGSVTGKVSLGGKPVGNVVVSFHPLDNGYVGSFPVKPDGTFAGELIAGNYSYYVGKSGDPNSAAVLKKIDPKFYEANTGRSISIEPGKEIVLALE